MTIALCLYWRGRAQRSVELATIALLALSMGLAGLVVGSAPARAQEVLEVSPLTDVENLARVVGAVHYRRQSCTNSQDQTWRDQMMRLLELEAPQDDARRRRLVKAFNDGYADEQRLRRLCAAGAEAELTLAAEGKRLAERLLTLYVQ